MYEGLHSNEDIHHELVLYKLMVNAALDGELDGAAYVEDPVFGLQVPTTCPNVPDEVLIPRNTWSDAAAYDLQAQKLANMFAENFKQFEDQTSDAIKAAGPKMG